MGESDRGVTDFGAPGGPSGDRVRHGSDPDATTRIRHAQRFGESTGSRRHSLVPDGGKNLDRQISERSQESIDIETDDLEQNPEQYETRDQAVIDRYEGLLAERQRRQRAADARQEDERCHRLERVKNQLLRVFGLR